MMRRKTSRSSRHTAAGAGSHRAGLAAAEEFWLPLSWITLSELTHQALEFDLGAQFNDPLRWYAEVRGGTDRVASYEGVEFLPP